MWCTPLQIVLTTVEPNKNHKGSSYDAYEYTAHSHTYITEDTPSMRVTYDLSPIQVGPHLNIQAELIAHSESTEILFCAADEWSKDKCKKIGGTPLL